MVALLYFEEKVHKKKLLEPMLFHFFPQIVMSDSGALGCRAGSLAGVEHPQIPHPEQPEDPQPIETPTDTRAPAPAVPCRAIPEEMIALRAHQEQIIATQTQHTAILRQIQHHLGIPSALEHQMPAPLEPTEPTAGDTETST
ncbi:hypothetical protein CK203_093977 [Vitis vinifera]|uniref:Uncharacterized protein n=1 Tax=Vitis vinifera TaxID=29760 RepID=A0A438CKA2_VITVI|nr:hypothetical protein CK203_093977 [Vitis vinifera]